MTTNIALYFNLAVWQKHAIRFVTIYGLSSGFDSDRTRDSIQTTLGPMHRVQDVLASELLTILLRLVPTIRKHGVSPQIHLKT
jgi:hypothetical protein